MRVAKFKLPGGEEISINYSSSTRSAKSLKGDFLSVNQEMNNGKQ